MTTGVVTRSIKTFVARDMLNAMMALAIFCLLVSVPFNAEAAKDQQQKPEAQMVASKVNINKANAEQLAEVLSGVGLKKAQAIVAYRKVNGKFKSVDELVEVKGIGDSTIAKNKGKIVL